MSSLILLILVFVLINTCLKLSFWKWWQTAIVGMVLGVFVLFMYPYAIEQSQTGLKMMLEDVEIRKDITVLLCIETLAYTGFCFIALTRLYQPKKSRTDRLFRYYPGILIFPVIFYVFTQVIFSFPGANFRRLALISAPVITIGAPLCSLGFKKLLPDKEFRLELLVISGLLALVLGLISTYNGSIIYKSNQETDLPHFLFGMCILFGMAGLGYVINRLVWRFKRNK